LSADMENPVYQLDGVGFDYPNGEMVLQDIDCTIVRGQQVALLGANGSGKSTLLKLLNGLMPISRGSLQVFGESLCPENLSKEAFAFDFHRRVGFVFQNSDAQLFNANVWDEIAFGPVQLGWPEAQVRQAVEDIISRLELDHLRKRPPFRLSGGEKKQVALASALVMNPEVLLLDEPTNGLDPRTQRKLIRIIRALAAEGKTVITATHNLDIVNEIADRVLVFSEQHRLVASGDSQDILNNLALLSGVNLVDEAFHLHQHAAETIVHSHGSTHLNEVRSGMQPGTEQTNRKVNDCRLPMQ